MSHLASNFGGTAHLPGDDAGSTLSSAARRPMRTTLEGRFVTLVPLSSTHADDLYEGSHGENCEELWRYMFAGPFADRKAFRADVEERSASDNPLFFGVIDKQSGRAVGLQAYLNIALAHRSIEVGYVLYTPALQRTVGATEAQYLFARHAFETLGYRRYEWKCDNLNEKSKHAAIRLGFTFEGVFRQHMIVKGRNRDTAWFSMLDREWPERRAAFDTWLAPGNFDTNGGQKLSLSALNRQS